MSCEKKERFGRIFPPRVEKLIKQLDVLSNCSNKSTYEFDTDLVQRCWVEIAKQLQVTAKCFGLDMIITVGGKNVREIDTSTTPKKHRNRDSRTNSNKNNKTNKSQS